jgi:hypothetical protein
MSSTSSRAPVTQPEADGISTRVRRQKQQRRELGLPHGGRKPFGWRNLMEPDPVESAALRDAMEAVVSGASLFDIAARWEAAGFGGPHRTAPWGSTDVRRVLIAPRHAGLVVHRGEIALDKDGNEIRAAWPAIVPRELWEACRSVLAARTVGVRVERQRSVLRGLLRCGACGSQMTQSSTRGRAIWRCWRDKRGCGAVSIGAEPLELALTEALFEYVEGDGVGLEPLRAVWHTMTTDQRRAAIQVTFGAVTIGPAASIGRRFDPTRISFGKPRLA